MKTTNQQLVVLAEKLWDEFRSLSFYRGTCRKTFGQLGIPLQNVWIAMAKTADRDVRFRLRRARRAKSA